MIFGRRRRSAASGPEQESRTTFGSIEELKATLDLDALRATRDAHGPIVAIRQLRTERPALGLAEANEIIQGL